MVANTAFIYLTAFSRTGGIEQFNKNVMASLQQSKVAADILSVHDRECNENYTNAHSFKGFSGNRIAFLLACVSKAKKYDRILIGHINLAFAALIIKKINPSVQLVLFAHGIEVWKQQKGAAAWLLNNADQIIAVSNFTKAQILSNNPIILADKIQLLPNGLDPFFKYPTSFAKPAYLQERYGIQPTDKVILSIARLSYEEQYKGYDSVIKILAQLNDAAASIKYLIVGKADAEELNRVKQLIAQEGLNDQVILAGFVESSELNDHYLLADLFVLPSVGEGFGIVLIEALACGLNVIAGNKDGSVDALLNGELGLLVDPTNSTDLHAAIMATLNSNQIDSALIQAKAKMHFSFNNFTNNLKHLIA